MKRLHALTAFCLLCLAFLSCRKEVDVDVAVDFSYQVIDSDYSIPVHIFFTNKTKGAQFYQWTFENGTPATYDKKDPGTILFTKAGSIKVKLEAWNDGQRKEKEITILLDSVVHADFDVAPVINNFGPTDFAITNRSLGTTQVTWQFENGNPATASGRNPAIVHFENPGTYRLKLEARNDRGEKDTISKLVTVKPALSAAFDITPSFDDDDYEAPLSATLSNHTTSATIHQWSAPGGTLSNSTDSIPTITYATPGTYTVTYQAGNGKQSQTVTKTITVLPNTRLSSFTNIKLGINTAHATIGSFFSTRLRRVFKEGEVNSSNGSLIDLPYFGLSESFNYDLFIRPDSAQNWTFSAIPGATETKFMNSQELCGCGSSFSSADFDAVMNGSAFDGMSITVNTGSRSPFSNAIVPRVVLFQNAAGKKGAIRIKQFVNSGQQSYILCDIKVQKD